MVSKYTIIMFYHTMIVLLEYTNYLLHKCMIIAINVDPIMLALCLALSVTHYAKNYDDILGRFLDTALRAIYICLKNIVRSHD